MALVNDIIGKLETLKGEEKISAKLPSLNKSVSFSPLNVKQQKNLLKQTLGGVSSLPDLLAEFNEIVIENCKENSDELMVYDRYSVLLQLRKNAYGNSIRVNGKAYDINDLPEADKAPTSLNKGEVSYKTISVKLKTPTLKEDTSFIKKSAAENRKNKISEDKDIISGMYILEIVKYIESLVFEGNELVFDTLPLSEKSRIVENLPVSLNQKILSFITEVRNFENKLITFSDGAMLPIDSLFAAQE